MVPLELMFEHRLYLPSVSVAVILAALLLVPRRKPAPQQDREVPS